MSDVCDNPEHAGHKVHFGGRMDGVVSHMTVSPERSPSHYPSNFGTMKRDGQRSWYVLTEINGTTAIYRCAGVGYDAPPEVLALQAQARGEATP